MPEMVVGAVCDVKPDRLQFVKETYGDIPCFESAEELMNSGLVDAVLIAVPHYSHPPAGNDGYEKGAACHVRKAGRRLHKTGEENERRCQNLQC